MLQREWHGTRAIHAPSIHHHGLQIRCNINWERKSKGLIFNAFKSVAYPKQVTAAGVLAAIISHRPLWLIKATNSLSIMQVVQQSTRKA